MHPVEVFYATLEDTDLFEVVRELSDGYSIRRFHLDEIHFQEGFESQLKKIYDFLDERIVFEVGGKGKGYEQFKGVSADRKLVFADGATINGNRRPLLSLGFLDEARREP